MVFGYIFLGDCGDGFWAIIDGLCKKHIFNWYMYANYIL